MAFFEFSRQIFESGSQRKNVENLTLCFLGMGPMPWTINSEIYPLWARSLGNSLATSTNWAFNLLISMTFLTLTETITKQGAFYLYTGIALLGFFTFLWLLPETKGKSLEEVEQLFAQPTKLPCQK